MTCSDLMVRFDSRLTVQGVVMEMKSLCGEFCGQACWDDYTYQKVTQLEASVTQPDPDQAWQDAVLLPFCRDVEPRTITALAAAGNHPPLVLAAIATSERTPPEALAGIAETVLAGDGSLDPVLELVAEHPNLSGALAMSLFVGLQRQGRWSGSETYEALAANPKTPAGVLRHLALCPRPAVRDAVADHPLTNDDSVRAVLRLVRAEPRYLVDRVRLWRDIDRLEAVSGSPRSRAQ